MKPHLLLALVGIFVSYIPASDGLSLEDVSFVSYFVKDWKQYHSVNVFSCPQCVSIRDLSSFNGQLIMSRYIDMRKPINLDQLGRDQDCRQVYVIDLKCPESLLLIRKLAEAKMFSTFCRSFLLLDNNEDEEWFRGYLEPVLQEVELTVTSDVILATKYFLNETFDDLDSIKDRLLKSQYFIYDLW